MKLENWQLVLLVISGFAAIIAADIIIQSRSNENFKLNFPGLPRAQFVKSISSALENEEQMAKDEDISLETGEVE